MTEWVEVNGFPEYEIHPKNGIRRKNKDSPLKGRTWFGYPKVTLMRDGRKHERRIHKLVAEHFLPNPDKKPIVNHKDSDRSNFSVDNLEWVDNSGNQVHRWMMQKKGLSRIKYTREYGMKKIELNKTAGELLGFNEKLKCFIQKSIVDELSAAAMYIKASNLITGLGSKEVSEELIEHAKEEFEHYMELMKFASARGFASDLKICLDDEVVDYFISYDTKTVVSKIQKMELDAAREYKMMVKCSMRHGDIEAARFFKELMSDELEHFDDLSYVNGDSRPELDNFGPADIIEKIAKENSSKCKKEVKENIMTQNKAKKMLYKETDIEKNAAPYQSILKTTARAAKSTRKEKNLADKIMGGGPIDMDKIKTYSKIGAGLAAGGGLAALSSK